MKTRELQRQRPSPHAGWSDPRLVRACLGGEQEAWNALLEKYKRLIYSIPIKQGLPPADATDVFQSVCVELVKELPRLREPRALGGWLIRVTTHKCYHWRRRGHRERILDDADALVETADPAPTLDELLNQLEREQILRECVVSLSKRCRKLISMLFLQTPAERYAVVAKKLGLAQGSIGFIRRRCLDRLRRKLDERGFGHLR